MKYCPISWTIFSISRDPLGVTKQVEQRDQQLLQDNITKKALYPGSYFYTPTSAEALFERFFLFVGL